MRLIKSGLLSSLLVNISFAATVEVSNEVTATAARIIVMAETKTLFETYQQKTTLTLRKILERDGMVSISKESTQISVMKAISIRLQELTNRVKILEQAQVDAGNEKAKTIQELELLKQQKLKCEDALGVATLKERDLKEQINTLKNSEKQAIDNACQNKLFIEKLEVELSAAKSQVESLTAKVNTLESKEKQAVIELRELTQAFNTINGEGRKMIQEALQPTVFSDSPIDFGSPIEIPKEIKDELENVTLDSDDSFNRAPLGIGDNLSPQSLLESVEGSPVGGVSSPIPRFSVEDTPAAQVQTRRAVDQEEVSRLKAELSSAQEIVAAGTTWTQEVPSPEKQKKLKEGAKKALERHLKYLAAQETIKKVTERLEQLGQATTD